MSTCAEISSDLTFDCNSPIVGGVRNEIILFNYDDFQGATITFNGSNTLIVEDIVLPSGVTGYTYSCPENGFNALASLVEGAYFPTYDHKIMGLVFDLSAAGKLQLEKLAKGKVVVLVKNNYKGTSGNAAYELYGYDVGLKLRQLDQDKKNKDNQSAYAFTLATPDDIKEPRLPRTVFITSYAVTTALVDSLVA